MAGSQMMYADGMWSPAPLSKPLNCYDANKDLPIIWNWFTMVNNQIHEKTALEQLEKEAKDLTGKPGSCMEVYLKIAMISTKSVPGLWKAENVVVLMYTNDTNTKAFYKEYNAASTERNWQPYKVYTTILISALYKLARIKPVPPGTYLYRGINCKLDPPTATQIYWKAFTSTSLNYQLAIDFAGSNGTVLVFQAPVSPYAAKVGELSNHPDEEEVMLLPFEAFDFLKADDKGFHFQSSKIQPLLPPPFDALIKTLTDGLQFTSSKIQPRLPCFFLIVFFFLVLFWFILGIIRSHFMRHNGTVKMAYCS